MKKICALIYLLSVIASGSAALAMEKEVQPTKEVAPLTELISKKIVVTLWDLIKEGEQQNPAKALIELNSLVQRLPQDVISQIINFNLQNIDNNAPVSLLIGAIKQKDPFIPLIKRLIELGADVTIKDKDDDTVLYNALFWLPETEESLAALQMIVNSSPDLINFWSIRPAAEKPKFVKFLIDNGYGINEIGDCRIPNANETIKVTPLDLLAIWSAIWSYDRTEDERKKVKQSMQILMEAGGKKVKVLEKEKEKK